MKQLAPIAFSLGLFFLLAGLLLKTAIPTVGFVVRHEVVSDLHGISNYYENYMWPYYMICLTVVGLSAIAMSKSK